MKDEKNKTSNIDKPKVIVILGTTSSGKTSLGVQLAVKYDGEIVSADSRQVYRGMDIGTGKDLKEYQIGKKNIPYHLIDVIDPNTKFSLADYKKLTTKALDDIIGRGKTPIIVGGTGLYLQAVIDNYRLSTFKPDQKLRDELESLSKEELYERLKKLNPKFAEKLNNSDKNNPRRLVRYLEVFSQENNFKLTTQKDRQPYNFLILGLDWPKEVLNARIKKRLLDRLEEGLVDEVAALHKNGVSWQRLISFGLEYKFVSWCLQKKIDYSEFVDKLTVAICQFAKKQKTWWKRWEKQGAKIYWIKDWEEANKKVLEFLKK